MTEMNCTTSRPPMPVLFAESIPADMKEAQQWLNWSYKLDGDRHTKAPLGGPGYAQRLLTFAQALANCSETIGLGFYLSNGFVGFDWDKLEDDARVAATAIIDSLPCYSETSVSGNGLHAICRVADATVFSAIASGKGPFEFYPNKRFFTVSTTNAKCSVLESCDDRVRELTEEYRPSTNVSVHEFPSYETITNRDTAIAAGRAALARFELAIQGSGGETTLCEAATLLIRGYGLVDFPEWLEAIEGYNEKCLPPFSDDDLERKFHEMQSSERGSAHEPLKALRNSQEFVWTQLYPNEPLPVHVRSFDQLDRTDEGNAQHFAAMHLDTLCYVPEWQSWAGFDGKRWVRKAKYLADIAARETIDDIAKQAKCEKSKEAMSCAASAMQAATRSNMLNTAQSLMICNAEKFAEDPMVLNVQNGTLDLRTQSLKPHDANDRIMTVSPVEFDPFATCERWKQFVNEIFANDVELVSYFQRLMGYMLTGDVREQSLFVFYGQGANGKSTVVDIVESLLGESLVCKAEQHLVIKTKGNQHPAAKAELFGKRICHLPETGEDQALDEEQIKTLTGGERIQARFMGQDFFRFMPTHKLILCTNHVPRINSQSEGIRRRVKLIPFDQCFSGAKCDHDLLHKLRAELPGILNWALEGCRLWLDGGLQEPEVIRAATQDYLDREDDVGRFLNEVFEMDAPESLTLRGEVISAYKLWCEQEEIIAKPNKTFYSYLRAKGLDPDARSHGDRYVRGLRKPQPA